MSYLLVTFDGVTLPSRNAAMPLDTGDVVPGIIQATGGAFDRYGTRKVLPQMRTISYTAGYSAATAATLRGSLDGLRAKIGTRGQLIRQRIDDSVQQWLYARLLSVNGEWRNEGTRYLEVTCSWETAEPSWRTTSAISTDRSLSSGTQNLTPVVGGTAPSSDGLITVTTSGTITAGTITCAALGVLINWTGSLTAGNTLTIDCGLKTVKVNAADAYSWLSFGTAHTALDWLPLTQGTPSIEFGVNGAGTANLAHWNRWY